jgi:hypothetical protein
MLAMAVVLLGALSPTVHGLELTIIELQHRPADEVIPIVTPFLKAGDTLSGQGYTLFLRTTADNLPHIRSVIQNLDRPSRQLMITVVQGEIARQDLQMFEGSAQLSVGDDIRVTLGHPPPGAKPDSAHFQARGMRTRKDRETVQRVRVSENSEAVISIGLWVPVLAKDRVARHSGAAVRTTPAYREVMTGFSVVPRVSGDRYVLDLATRKEEISETGRGGIGTQRIHTQVHGRLREWMDIGGIVDTAYRDRYGGFSREDEAVDAERNVWIRVEEVR